MIEALGGEGAVPINLNAAAPVPILMVGLQGSGKTTTAGKIALRLQERLKQTRAAGQPRHAAPRRAAAVGSNSPSRRGVPSLPIVAGQTPVQIASRAMDTGRREGFDIVMLDTAGRLSIDEALMDEVPQDPRRHQPGRDAAGGRCHDRPGRGQHRQGVQRRARRHRHRADPYGRRRPRRRGAVDARHHRRPDQADRRRREAGRAGGFPPRTRRRPHPRHGRHRRPGGEARPRRSIRRRPKSSPPR